MFVTCTGQHFDRILIHARVLLFSRKMKPPLSLKLSKHGLRMHFEIVQ